MPSAAPMRGEQAPWRVWLPVGGGDVLAAGLTVVVAQDWFRQGGRTPPLAGEARFQSLTLPFSESLAGVPGIGPIYAERWVELLQRAELAWIEEAGHRVPYEQPAAVAQAIAAFLDQRAG